MHTLLLTLLLASAPSHAADSVLPAPAPVVSQEYRIGPRDAIRVDIFGEPQMSGVFAVRPDGTVALPLLQPTPVAGMTVSEASIQLETIYNVGLLRDPHITVRIESYGASQVRISGSVKNPNTYPLSEPTTLLDLIIKAGGPVDDIDEIIVRRADGTEVTLAADEILSGVNPFVVADGDIITVMRGKKVFINGQVKNAGAVPFSDGLTVSKALTLAGDVSASARLSGVYIIREGKRIRVNMARIRRGRAPDRMLLPDDEIVVPESAFK